MKSRDGYSIFNPLNVDFFISMPEENAMDKYQKSQKDKLFKSTVHDPYRVQRVEGSAVCPHCKIGLGSWRPGNSLASV